MHPMGFCSEHTAEYFLVPPLVQCLSRTHRRVIPIFFWASREGRHQPQRHEQLTKIRLLTVFARRPKVNEENSLIGVKFNQQLFETALIGDKYGVPTLAGVPLASSLFELHSDISVTWFRLRGLTYGDEYFEIDPSVPFGDQRANTKRFVGPLSENELQEIAAEAQSLTWETAVDVMRQIRRGTASAYSRFGGTYKPFNVILNI